MPVIKNKFLFLFLTFFLSISYLSASHLMGGEITWTCTGNGKYVFTLKIYRDCNGIPGPSSATICTTAPSGNISCNLISQTDNSPKCNPAGPAITCAAAEISPTDIPGAVEEFIFRSNPVTLNGIPPSSGWVFYYSDCCRNNAIDN